MGKNKITTKQITTISVLIALSLIAFMIENLFPPILVPGAKIGISNLVSFFALFTLSPTSAIIIVVAKTLLSCFIVGNLSMLMYSFTAGVLSIFLAILLKFLFYPKISVVSISVCSAVVHNLVQNLVFCLVTSSTYMLAYFPYLGICGVISGIIVGVTLQLTLRVMPLKLYNQLS